MPLLNKSMRLAAITSCVFGMYCAESFAQAPPAAPRKVAGAPGKAPLNNRPPLAGNRQALPQAQPFRIPKLSPEMEDILVEWEEKSAQIKRLEGTFVRTTYDSVFGVELVSEGKYCFQFPDLGSFHQTGTPKAEGQKGNRFVQKPGPDERWVCDGTRILKINDKSKEFEEVEIPKEDRGQNIRNSPLPFLFGMKAAEAKQRYTFELNSQKTNESTIWLKVYPLLQQDLANYSKAEVILDRTNCLPLAVKLYDTTGNKEDVYLFSKKNMIVNGRGGWARWLTGDPLKPDLTRYHKMIAPANAGAPQGQQLAAPPTNRRNASVPPAGGKTLGPKSLPQRTAQVPDDDEPPARATTRKRTQP